MGDVGNRILGIQKVRKSEILGSELDSELGDSRMGSVGARKIVCQNIGKSENMESEMYSEVLFYTYYVLDFFVVKFLSS